MFFIMPINYSSISVNTVVIYEWMCFMYNNMIDAEIKIKKIDFGGI